MKHIIQAIVLAALITGAQASSADAFPGNGDPVALPAQWTHADRNASGIAQGVSVDPFPGNGDPVALPSVSTYSAQFVVERNVQARGASDPALSQ